MFASAFNLWDAARRAVERLIGFVGGGPAALGALRLTRDFRRMILERIEAIEQLTREALRHEAALLAGRARPQSPASIAGTQGPATQAPGEAAMAESGPPRRLETALAFRVTISPPTPPDARPFGRRAADDEWTEPDDISDARPLARRLEAVIAVLDDPRDLIARLARRLGATDAETPQLWRGAPPTERDWRRRIAPLERRPAALANTS